MKRTLISVCLKPAPFGINENSEKSQFKIFSCSQNTLFTLNVLEKIGSTSENIGVSVCVCVLKEAMSHRVIMLLITIANLANARHGRPSFVGHRSPRDSSNNTGYGH